MEVTATTRNCRMSAEKGHPLAREVQGLPVADALRLVEFSPRKAATFLSKTLKSAIANAKNNDNLDVDTLKVKQSVFDNGATMSRFWPRARGSASPIAKRTCHCKVVLTDGQ